MTPTRASLICTAALLMCTAARAADPALPPGAVAVVNGQPLSRAVFEELVRARQAKGSSPTETQDRSRILEDLVNTELLSQRAQASGAASRPQVRAELELAHKTLLGQRLLQKMIAEMQIDEAELQARYRALPPNEQIVASHILVKDESTARDLIAQLQRGASFVALAKKHSLDAESRERGGAVGPIAMSELVPPFAAAARALKPGQTTSAPVQTEFGWHVIKLTSLRTEPSPAFDTLRKSLRDQIVSERLQAQVAQWRKEAKLNVLQAP